MNNLIHIIFFSCYTFRIGKKDKHDTAMAYSVGLLTMSAIFLFVSLFQIGAYYLGHEEWIDEYIFSPNRGLVIFILFGIGGGLHAWYGHFIDFDLFLKKYSQHRIVKHNPAIVMLSVFIISVICGLGTTICLK